MTAILCQLFSAIYFTANKDFLPFWLWQIHFSACAQKFLAKSQIADILVAK